MAFAADTTITVPSGAMQIGELRAGDMVLAADLELHWYQHRVKFAEAATGQFFAAFLQFEEDRQLVVTFDQLFLMTDRTLRRADHLKPGDTVAGNGNRAVRLLEIAAGNYHGDICDIATSATDTAHLLDANGIIAGDFDMQVGHFEQRRRS